MILRPFLHTDPVAISYLFGCGGKASAPLSIRSATSGPISPLPKRPAWHPVRHRHAPACRPRVGRPAARRCRGRRVRTVRRRPGRAAFQRRRDRSVLPLGNVVAEVLHTPGHTPEHVSLLVTDRTRADEPWFVLTGHTLMVGDVGRTELATTAEDGARVLFRSMQRLKALPDYVEVLPGAFSGSVCGRRLSGKPSSTIGFERRHNAAFRIEDEDAFVRSMQADIPVPPPRAAELRGINAGSVAV